jgi:hypothetical protein
MGRKPTPQPLDISSGDGTADRDPNGDFNNNKIYIDAPPRSAPLSLRSPISPRSPFRFSSKVVQGGFGSQPSVHLVEHQDPSRNPPSSPTNPLLPTLQQPLGIGRQEDLGRGQERERPSTSPVRAGFFSNYKASKSSSRLLPVDAIRQLTEETMSRDGDQSELSGSVLTLEGRKNGITLMFR